MEKVHLATWRGGVSGTWLIQAEGLRGRGKAVGAWIIGWRERDRKAGEWILIEMPNSEKKEKRKGSGKRNGNIWQYCFLGNEKKRKMKKRTEKRKKLLAKSWPKNGIKGRVGGNGIHFSGPTTKASFTVTRYPVRDKIASGLIKSKNLYNLNSSIENLLFEFRKSGSCSLFPFHFRKF